VGENANAIVISKHADLRAVLRWTGMRNTFDLQNPKGRTAYDKVALFIAVSSCFVT
jgi:hypothetical protein